MKAEKPMEDYGMELNEQALTEEEQEELAQESDEENAKRYGVRIWRYQSMCKSSGMLLWKK